MEIAEFQHQIERIYFEKDSARGIDGNFRWLMEEVGELARAVRRRDPKQMAEEFSDVFAWLCTLASICGVELTDATCKYANGCPKCGATPCECP